MGSYTGSHKSEFNISFVLIGYMKKCEKILVYFMVCTVGY